MRPVALIIFVPLLEFKIGPRLAELRGVLFYVQLVAIRIQFGTHNKM
jgi:hypothetical protein